MTTRKARKPKNEYSKPSRAYLHQVHGELEAASIFKPKPDPIKALLRKHPGPWQARFLSWGQFLFDAKGKTVPLTRIARAIAQLARRKK